MASAGHSRHLCRDRRIILVDETGNFGSYPPLPPVLCHCLTVRSKHFSASGFVVSTLVLPRRFRAYNWKDWEKKYGHDREYVNQERGKCNG